jgi:hypothetical protein
VFAVQLLGLRGRDSYLDPQILAAYEALAAAPIEEGFSEKAADGRTCLLQEAVDALRRGKGGRPVQEKSINVEWALLPGALSLLEEVWSLQVPQQQQFDTCLSLAAKQSNSSLQRTRLNELQI